jgi:hypothetical protein
VLTTETTLASKTLPVGTILLYSPYVIRRREDLYPHPDRFDPDRWLSDHTTPLCRGALIPFGGGAEPANLSAKLSLCWKPLSLWQPLPHAGNSTSSPA